MKKQFVTYEIALKLKELGFDEECFGRYFKQEFKVHIQFENITKFFTNKRILELEVRNPDMPKDQCIAPLWQQVIDWFREKHNLNIVVLELDPRYSDDKTKIHWLFSIQGLGKDNRIILDNLKYESYAEAREQAILKAIGVIKKK